MAVTRVGRSCMANITGSKSMVRRAARSHMRSRLASTAAQPTHKAASTGHGSAMDIAGTGTARPDALLRSLRLVAGLS